MNTSKEVETAVAAALEGAKIIQYYHQNREKLQVDYKGRHDLVTQADVETEQRIISEIRSVFPNDIILGEETTDGSRLTNERTWIIDPIDGTTNFAHGFPVFCISIGFYTGGKAEAGLIYEINREEMFMAQKGAGAWLNGSKIRVSEIQEPASALLGTGFPYRDLGLLDDYMLLFRKFMEETHGVRRPGSAAYDLVCVASGRLDGFFEYGLSPWDVAAGGLIIQEAGGIVTDWTGGDSWVEGKRIVCGNPQIWKYVSESIKETIAGNSLVHKG
ncbi:MAG: inositol monophosphatase [Balneolales bacterium]|nr:inositol monophosphatase [Balneolales bacterium]